MADTIIKTRLLAAFLSSAINQSELVSDAWTSRTNVNAGDSLIAGSRLYIVITSGRTGATPPEHVSGVLADGSASLLFLRFEDPDRALGKNFFMGFGGSPDLSNRTIDETSDYQRASLSETVAFLRLQKSDMCLSVPRQDWVSGVVVPEYPDELSYTTNGGAVYRCLSNNGGIVSTAKPDIEYTEPFETADGYIWKYLGTIDNTTLGRFRTATHFPIKPLFVDDGSIRWQVQETARDGAISTFTTLQQVGTFTTPLATVVGAGTGGVPAVTLSLTGAVTRVTVSNTGKDYAERDFVSIQETGAPGVDAALSATLIGGELTAVAVDSGGNTYTDGAQVFVIGDGTGAAVSLTLASGVITGATVASAGSGYTWARIVVIPGAAGAVAQLVLSPLGGHGRDMVNQLPVNSVTLHKTITAQDKALVDGAEFYQISLVTGLPSGSNMTGPAHASGVVKLGDITSASVLSASNHPMFEHLDDQDEKIRTTLSLK